MSFFQEELARLLENERIKKKGMITYAGRAAYIPLGGGCRAKAEFVTLRIADKYEANRIAVLNIREGMVDSLDFRFDDYFAPMPAGGNARHTVIPYIWICDEKPKWYTKPDSADFAALSSDIWRYIKLFA